MGGGRTGAGETRNGPAVEAASPPAVTWIRNAAPVRAVA